MKCNDSTVKCNDSTVKCNNSMVKCNDGMVLYIGNKIFFVLAFTRLILYGRYILFWLSVQL